MQATFVTAFSGAEAPRRPSLISRFFAAMADSRSRAAAREVRARAFLFDRPLDGTAAAPGRGPVDRAALPFTR